MKSFHKSLLNISFPLVLGFVVFNPAFAHLMVAQHGTLNFLDDNVYLVLSLPATAFSGVDEDGDGKLSMTEFAQHRSELIDTVSDKVTLADAGGNRPLQGIMVSPVTPHDAPKMPADQIIVMGRFVLESSSRDLHFHVGLYGNEPAKQTLEITATHKSANRKDVFTLSPGLSKKMLFAGQ